MRTTNYHILVLVGCLMIAWALVPFQLAAQSDGPGIFKSRCVLCHGPNADGDTPAGKALNAKNLRSAEVQSKAEAELIHVVTNGENKMPAFGQILKPEQIQEVVSYVRGLGVK